MSGLRIALKLAMTSKEGKKKEGGRTLDTCIKVAVIVTSRRSSVLCVICEFCGSTRGNISLTWDLRLEIASREPAAVSRQYT